MRYFLVIISVALVAIAGCSMSGGEGADDADLSVVREKVDCKLEPFNPACAAGAGGEEIIPEEEEEDDETETGTTTTGFSVAGGSKTIVAEKNAPLQIPFSIVEGTGKGPFFWTFDGLWTGANIIATGAGYRQATIYWTPAEYKKVYFTVMVSDQGQPTLAPRTVKVGVVVNEPVKIMARYVGSSSDEIETTNTGGTTWKANETVDLSSPGSIWLRLKVPNLTKGPGYEFRTASTRFKLLSPSCDSAFCEVTVEPKYYTQDLTNVSFTVTSKATGYSSTLTIPKVKLVPEGYVPEDSPDACSDGVDNDLDGNIDCKDTECQWIYPCREKENTNALCSPDDKDAKGNPLDNDGDGLANCDDPDCNSIYVTVCRNWNINPQIGTVSKVRVTIGSRNELWPGAIYNGTVRMKFCKDREMNKCTAWSGPDSFVQSIYNNKDDKYDLINEYDADDVFKGKLLGKEYLNYVRLEFTAKEAQDDRIYVDSVKVEYKLSDDLPTSDYRIAYWNPCAGEVIPIYKPYKQYMRLGKNDTAVCFFNKAGHDLGDDEKLVMSGARWYDDDPDFKPNQIWWGSDFKHVFSPDTDYTNLLSLDLFGREDAESYYYHRRHGYIFDCNPFNYQDCETQRGLFDSSGTIATFSSNMSKGFVRLTSTGSAEFDFYEAFIFQPGNAWQYNSNGKNSVKSSAIYMAYDENSQNEVVEDKEPSKKCTPITSSSLWTSDPVSKYQDMGHEKILPLALSNFCSGT